MGPTLVVYLSSDSILETSSGKPRCRLPSHSALEQTSGGSRWILGLSSDGSVAPGSLTPLMSSSPPPPVFLSVTLGFLPAIPSVHPLYSSTDFRISSDILIS